MEMSKGSYQRIEVSGRVVGGVEDRSATAEAIFPADMAGKTFLDVGSMSGYFPFEALRRGASASHGVDMNPGYVSDALRLADELSLAAEFSVCDLNSEELPGKFDVVTCLNVLHHVFDPILAIEKLSSAARELLVLEVAGLGRHECRKLGLSRFAGWFLRRQPVVFVRGPRARRGGAQRYFISDRAMVAILEHTGQFRSIEVRPSPFKGRYLVFCRKATG